MHFHRRIEARRRKKAPLVTVLAAISATILVEPASAQSFFDTLFRGAPSPAAQPIPAPASAPAEHTATITPASDRSAGSGRSVAYCVRLCDGRYFPIQRHHAATPAQLCSAFCPTSKTKVFYGSDIERAAGSGGERYADLDNAFVYRRHIVNACTCNGKDAFGLARLEAGADPTLQAGDVVATDSGLVAVTRQRRGAAQTRASAPTPPKLANRGSD